MLKQRFTSILYGFLLLFPISGHAEPALETLTVLALSANDARAVLRWPDGSLHLVQRGEQLPGTTATVVQVLPDKLLLEERITPPGQAPVQHQVWLYQVPVAGGAAQSLRFQPEPAAHESNIFPISRPMPLPQ
jgi:hypothetical protein